MSNTVTKEWLGHFDAALSRPDPSDEHGTYSPNHIRRVEDAMELADIACDMIDQRRQQDAKAEYKARETLDSGAHGLPGSEADHARLRADAGLTPTDPTDDY